MSRRRVLNNLPIVIIEHSPAHAWSNINSPKTGETDHSGKLSVIMNAGSLDESAPDEDSDV